MSYSPVYTSEAEIEKLLQIELDESSHPSATDVNGWIEEVEYDIIKKGLGTQTAVSGTVMTVPATEAMSRNTVTWFIQGLPESQHGRYVIPQYKPIISVTSGSFHKNTAGLSSTPSWNLLVCKDNLPGADDTDFLIVKRFNYKTGDYVGEAFYFYNDVPDAGQRRLSGSWVYGWNLDARILREYATLQVASKVLFAMLMSGEPVGESYYRGPDLEGHSNTAFREVLLDYIATRLEKIEKDHFPEEIPIAVIQGI